MDDRQLVASHVTLGPDRTIVVTPGKVELGQGILTALVAEVAGALSVGPARVRLRAVRTGLSPNEGYTAGSLSVSTSVAAAREAAAALRSHLACIAAKQLRCSPEDLWVDDGVFTAPAAPTAVTYWDLAPHVDPLLGIATDTDCVPLPPVAVLRVDLPAKFAGAAAFLHDMAIDGMLHGRAVRPRQRHARAASVSTLRVDDLDGIVRVVHDGDFLGVVADREETAVRAENMLRADSTWSSTGELPDEARLESYLREQPHVDECHERRGPAADPVRVHSATYMRPFLAHASIGTSVAIAQWSAALDAVEIWTHSQGVYPLRHDIALTFGLSEPAVRVTHIQGAGCYGHNGADDVALDAALLARSVPGRPVRVAWSREDELSWSPLGPAAMVDVRAGIAADGTVVSWDTEIWSQGHNNRPGSFDTPALLGAAERTPGSALPPATDAPLASGGGSLRNALPYYTFGSRSAVAHRLETTSIRTSSLRSLGAFLNVFAIESSMDDLAAEEGVDPVEFRLRHLSDPRAAEVITAAVEQSGWRRAEPRPDTGFGLGFARYKNTSGYCAVVAEVQADTRLVVRRLTAAVDVGRVVTADGVANQVEGGAIQATSWATTESVHFDRASILSHTWSTYPILRFGEVPPVSVTVLDRPTEVPLGAGEIAQGPTAAAIGNALRAAVGVRVRRLPLTYDAIVAAIGA